MNLPDDFKKRMKAMLGTEYSDFINAFENDINYRGIRINKLKYNQKSLIPEFLREYERVNWCDDGYYIQSDLLNGKHPYHAAGLFYFQEPSAMAPVEYLDIKPGMKVLDICASPGGKSTQAAAYLRGEGVLVANEIIPKRAKILSENIERMGIKNAVVTNENPIKLKNKYSEFFDRIILDAPCSGEGMFRKDEKAIEQWSINHTKTCAVRQKHIFDCCIDMLSPGGKIVYSTCTFSPEENEGVIEYVLNTYENMHLVDIENEEFSNGCGDFIDAKNDLSKTKRIYPHKNKGEGHFIALLQKDAENIKTKNCEGRKNLTKYNEMLKDFVKEIPTGEMIEFKGSLYLKPESIDIDKIVTLRPGLEIGKMQKGRFIPSHALSHAFSKENFVKCINFSPEDDEVKKYLKGHTISSDLKGWCCVSVGAIPLGWAKGSDGVLKNHYPKHLRLI